MKVTPKKLFTSLSERIKSPPGMGYPTVKKLTPGEFLLRQRALRYLVDQSLASKEVATKLKITVRKLNSFMLEPDFVEELNLRVERVLGVDADYRNEQAKISITHLYEEIRRREAEDELRDVPLRDLHSILINMQKELRLDTPGEYTSKVGVGDLSRLQDRYKNSLSGKLARKKSLRPVKKLSVKETLSIEEESSREDEESSEENRAGRSG